MRALLVMLLLHANETVSRDRLMTGIWGDRPPPSAGHTLDGYLSRLRKVLGPDRILRRPGGYAVRVEPGELDLDRFEAGLARGTQLGAAGELERAATCLGDALALWRGAALADLVDEPFVVAAAHRLEERRLLAVEEYADASLACGRNDDVRELLERLVAEHPFRERLRGLLMRSLYLAGRQAQALSVYEEARRLLSEELGIEPGAELQRLHRAVLTQDPSLAPPRPASRDPREPTLPPRRSRRGTRLALGAAAAVVVVVAALALATTSGRSPDPSRGSEVRALRLDQAPAAVASGFGSLWLAMPGDGSVWRVDAESGQVSDRIPVGDPPGAVTVGDGAVWSVQVPGDVVSRIDAETGTVVQAIRLGRARVGALAYGGDRLWAADTAGHAVLEIDPRTGLVDRRIPLPLKPTSLLVVDAALWLADYGNSQVAQVDIASGQTLDALHVGNGPTALALVDRDIWVANALDSTVSRVDADTPSVVATIPVGSGPVDIASGPDAVWVVNQYSATVSRIDPALNAVEETTSIDGEPVAIALGKGAPWVGVVAARPRRGGTLRLLHSRPITLDPAFQADLLPLVSDRLVRSNLVAYRHSAGPRGTQLVPDLAVAVPTPASGATTFTFRLRPGIVYSDGAPVLAGDFRRAIERVIALRTEASHAFMGIRGAESCMPSHTMTCDLAEGIVTDDRSGTVVFHLAEPDPEFVEKLTVPAAAPVPADTPYRDMGLESIAGTGPYVVARASAAQVRYVRNPHFEERSHAAQPDGLSDEIVLELGLTPEEQTAEVLAGRADWAPGVAPALLADVRRHVPDQVHRVAIPTTDFFQFNLRLAPFDDVRVRQALNLAVDRERLVELFGGPDLATPTCQVLPPGIPGYRPYCPYRVDLDRARRLVRASGAQGTDVTVWGFTDDPTISPAVTRYVGGVLRELGFEVTVRLASRETFGRVPLDRIQIISGAWGNDSAHGMLSNWFSCGASGNHGWFCDPKVDRALGRAQRLVARDPRGAQRIWASLDRRITDRAGWLPMINEHGLEIVSERVHNYQFHPYWGFIADQAWVE